MRCSSCESENPRATRFRGNCGSPLKRCCSKCGFENPLQFRERVSSAVNLTTGLAPKVTGLWVVISFALAWLPNLAPVAWDQPVGSITQLSGSAQLRRAGLTQTPAVGTVVVLHDQLTTMPDSAVTVTLADNSTLSLSQSTTLVFDENVVAGGTRQRTLVGLLSGAVNSVITTAMRSGNPTFQINTPNAQVGVRGTDFETSYTEGTPRPGYEGCQRYTDVVVRKGVVVVSNRVNLAAEVDVPGGYETTVPCLLPPLAAGLIGIGGGAAPPPAVGAPPSGLPPFKQ